MVGLQPLEKVPLYFSIFDMFVLPAYWEGFGNVIIQASAMGIPVLATNVTGCMDAVKNNYSGTLIKSKSIDALKKGIEKFLSSKKEIKKFGENGKIWAENFKPEIIWAGIDKIYKSDG
jgi:glycosyltransferase involved in cell wall biosynthesis